MKTILLSFGLLLLGSISFGQTKSVSDYFMFKKGVKYSYKALGPDRSGKIPTISYLCTYIETSINEKKAMFDVVTQFAGKAQEIYQTKGNTIALVYSENAFSGGDIIPHKIILKVPSANSISKWIGSNSDFYEASFVESIKTTKQTYSDCILVTTITKLEGKVYRTEKKYYAKNIGLVKIEFYDGKGVLDEMMSFELEKYE